MIHLECNGDIYPVRVYEELNPQIMSSSYYWRSHNQEELTSNFSNEDDMVSPNGDGRRKPDDGMMSRDGVSIGDGMASRVKDTHGKV